MPISLEIIDFQMWFILVLTICAAYAFVREKYPIEVISITLLTVLLVYGQLFPVLDANGKNRLDAMELLAGFANPALMAVLALLVLGQGLIHTGALSPVTRMFMSTKKKWVWFSVGAILVLVTTLSAFMNNTPLVILAIPIVQALAASANFSESRVLMPLSFAAILGGMVTLVGSSTNMLVSSELIKMGYEGISFFDFAVSGMILASVGFVYVLFILPKFLSDRSSLAQQLVGKEKEFIAEIDVPEDSKLIGMECVDGSFPKLSDLKIRLIQRAGHLILPPFEGYAIEKGDIIIVAATRKSLTEILSKNPGFLLSKEEAELMAPSKKQDDEKDEEGDADTEKPVVDSEVKAAKTRILAEIMIPPASRLVDMSLEHVGFHRQFGTIVLGIQRRARVVRRRLGRIRLEAGDVLLIAGERASIDALRNNPDIITLSGSKKELPIFKNAPIAAGIMLGTISLAATGVLSIPVAAIAGCLAMIATNCLNVRQATRAIDRKIFLLVGSMLALGVALQATGGAIFVSESILGLPFAGNTLAMAAVLFIVVAICTNILSNNACAILFTPIAVNMAINLGADPAVFAITVLFAANCSFASPIGYQTNLLIMGPGHYRFKDFIKGGAPLVIIIWISYVFVAKYYYGL